jgi:hypothetical protein
MRYLDAEEQERWWEAMEDGDPMYPGLSDKDFSGLPDSYDDGRIDAVVRGYLDLRQRVKAALAKGLDV